MTCKQKRIKSVFQLESIIAGEAEKTDTAHYLLLFVVALKDVIRVKTLVKHGCLLGYTTHGDFSSVVVILVLWLRNSILTGKST